MCQIVFSIVFSVVISHTCTPAIATLTPKSEGLDHLYEAMIDLSERCNGNPRRSAVGVVGDSEGSILKTLWSNNFVPAVLTDTGMKIVSSVTDLNLPKLQVLVIAATSPKRWDNEADFLKPNPTPYTKYQSSKIDKCPYTAFEEFGVFNTQFIHLDRTMNLWIVNCNRFEHRTPKFWALGLFKRIYRNCENLNLAKTMATGNSFHSVSHWPRFTHQITDKFNKLPPKAGNNLVTWIEYLAVRSNQFVIDNIAIGPKASAPLIENSNKVSDVITLEPPWISTKNGLFGVTEL